MSGLRCLALDSDEPALAELTYLLRHNARVDSVHMHTDIKTAANEAKQKNVDVVFVCLIHHSPESINETFQTLNDGPLFVALARTEELAIHAYKVGAVDYLLKPLTAQAIERALRRVESLVGPRAARTERRITCENNGALHLIDVRDVLHIRSNGDYSIVTTAHGEFVSRTSLTTLSENFGQDGLLRVHRQWLVPISRVDVLLIDGGQNYAIIQGFRVPVARRSARTVRDLLR